MFYYFLSMLLLTDALQMIFTTPVYYYSMVLE